MNSDKKLRFQYGVSRLLLAELVIVANGLVSSSIDYFKYETFVGFCLGLTIRISSSSINQSLRA